MRIFQGLIDIAGQPAQLSRALRLIGHDSESWVYQPNKYEYQNDRVLRPITRNSGNRARFENIRFMIEALLRFDVWHFHKGYSFLHGGKDLRIAKLSKKNVVIHYRGREIRSQIGQKNLESKQVKRIESQIKYADIVCVHDGELAELIKPLWPNPIVFPNIVSVENSSSFSDKEECNKRRFRIVHIPSNPEIKGTSYIRNATNSLGNQIDYIELSNITHSEALSCISSADLVIDQMLIGTYGNISLEAMAFGKPVICYLREDLQKYLPCDIPIINANKDTLFTKLSYLLNNRELLTEAGIQGINYIEKYHTPKKVAEEAIKLYKSIMAK